MPALFVVNPAAGRVASLQVLDRIRAASVAPTEVVQSTRAGEASKIAEEAARHGFGPVVAVGGDGTVMDVANGLMRCESPPPLGIVPAGAGNDLARTLGIPRDPTDAIQRVWSSVCDPIDVGRCNDRFFLNVAGAGLDTEVALAMQQARSRLLKGQAGYLLHGLRRLRHFDNPEFVIRLDDREIVTRSLLVAVANAKYFAGGMEICPDADVTDGMLEVCVAGDLTHREALTQIPMIYLGRHIHHPKVKVYRARRVHIQQPSGLTVQLDGEVVEALPAEFTIVPHALCIAGWSAGADRQER